MWYNTRENKAKNLWIISITRIDGRIEELLEMPDGEASVACARGSCTGLDIIEHGLCIWFRGERSPMVVVPRSFLGIGSDIVVIRRSDAHLLVAQDLYIK